MQKRDERTDTRTDGRKAFLLRPQAGDKNSIRDHCTTQTVEITSDTITYRTYV